MKQLKVKKAIAVLLSSICIHVCVSPASAEGNMVYEQDTSSGTESDSSSNIITENHINCKKIDSDDDGEYDCVEVYKCDPLLEHADICENIDDLPVTMIGEKAFRDCEALVSADIPNTVEQMGFWAFAGCTGLTSISLPDSLSTVSGCAFQDCTSLKDIKLPDSISAIDFKAFENTAIESIFIPKSVSIINCNAFWGCKYLEEINVSTENNIYCSEDGVLFDKEHTTILYYPEGKPNTEYVIPNGIEIIGNETFYKNSNLVKVSIPCSVVEIGFRAFYHCSNIKEIPVPNSVKQVKFSAFGSCTNLMRVSLPNSIESIEDYTFSNCRSLAYINIPNSVVQIKAGAFSSCIALKEVTIPKNVEQIYYDAFGLCASLKSITVLNPECDIKDYNNVFFNSYDKFADGTENLASTLFNGVIYGYSGSTAQAYAEKYGRKFTVLKSKMILGDINSDEKVTFNDIALLQSFLSKAAVLNDSQIQAADINKDGKVNIFDLIILKRESDDNILKKEEIIVNSGEAGYLTRWELTADDTLRFYRKEECDVNGKINGYYRTETMEVVIHIPIGGPWPNAKKLIIEDNIRNIGIGAFYGKSYDEVEIYNSDTTIIDEMAFKECNIGKMTVYSKNCYYKNSAFAESKIKVLDMSNCQFGKFEDYCFYKSKDLIEFKMPVSVKSIGKHAFQFCESLETIEFSQDLEILNEFAIDYCSNLKSIKLPDSLKKICGCNFVGSPLSGSIILPKNLELLSNSFVKTQINEFVFPNKDTKIYSLDTDAEKITIRGYKGSTAEDYAIKNEKCIFIPLNESE